MFSVSNLSVHFTGEFIFRNVTFNIRQKDRIGLVGKNGAGKSTLLNILHGDLEPQEGALAMPDGATIGYLKQHIKTESRVSVFEEALKAFAPLKKLEQQITQITQDISRRTDYESEDYARLIEKLNDSNDQFHIRGGQTVEGDTEKVLKGLGFEAVDFHRPLNKFSGGWQMRVELAKILLQKPDLLLLDEPTNHLDILSIQWLEDFLTAYPGAVVLVSHDRTFLDRVSNRTIEISMKKIFDYKTSYSDYVKQREAQRALQQAAYENQQKQIAETERFIERFRYKDSKATQVQSRIRQLEKIDRIEVDETDNEQIYFRFSPAPHSGKIVFEGRKLSMNYGDKQVLTNIDLVIQRNDFVAFVGRNGEGKSTLSKIMAGELAHGGERIVGHNVRIGYYAQNEAEKLDGEKTVFATIDDEATGDLRTKVKAILGTFLFRDDDLDKKVKVLSGGEKSRLAIAKMLLKPVNLLILDEPTNHLDMASKEILKKALLQYDGTLVVVSHDRDFLHGLTNKIYEVRNHQIKFFSGDIFDFLRHREMNSLDELDTVRPSKKAEKVLKNTAGKEIYLERKAMEKERRKLNKAIQSCEEEIEVLEAEIANINDLLADPEKNARPIQEENLYDRYENKKTLLSETMEKWEKLHSDFEKLS
jgi:ATP-binding cassette subfamily F protein 3